VWRATEKKGRLKITHEVSQEEAEVLSIGGYGGAGVSIGRTFELAFRLSI